MILKDKVVIVSGIGPGLGTAMAELAAKEGAKLVISARTPEKLEACAKAIADGGSGAEVLTCPTDITDAAACAALVEQAKARFGQIDILINSAYATGGYTLAADVELDDWRQTMETNLFGTMNMVQAAVPVMKAQGVGSIVNVNTKVSRMPHETMGGYAVSKAALRMATTQLAKELGGTGIRLNSVFPGWMWGSTVEKGLQAQADAEGKTLEQVCAKITRQIPIGRIPEDKECAKAVIALSSDYFTATTGACLDLSGGEYMPL